VLESAVVIGNSNEALFWFLPADRSATHIPDSRLLWEYIWENREWIKGVAHSHPGSGIPVPSWEDLTTFSAMEKALGKELSWWIVTSDDWLEFRKDSKDDDYSYGALQPMEPSNREDPSWLSKLRQYSYCVGEEEILEEEAPKVPPKPTPYVTYNWDRVRAWLRDSGVVHPEDVAAFEVYLDLTQEFGADRGFQISSEDLEHHVWKGSGLWKKYNGKTIPTDPQYRAIVAILEHFGSEPDEDGYQYVNFGGSQ
jgi:hypothetical protein